MQVFLVTLGETLEKCMIMVGLRRKEEAAGDVGQGTKAMEDEEEEDEVKERVFWVIRALMDACKRHDYGTRELIGEHPGLARLRMSDAAGEGMVEIDDRGLDECRKCTLSREGCRVPRVRMQMWYVRKMEVGCEGEMLKVATLVVVRTVKDGSMDMVVGDEAAVATEAFGADGYKEAIGEEQGLFSGDEFFSHIKALLFRLKCVHAYNSSAPHLVKVYVKL